MKKQIFTLILIVGLFSSLSLRSQVVPMGLTFPATPTSPLTFFPVMTLPADDGSFFICGQFTGTLDFDTTSALYDFNNPLFTSDIYIAHFDSIGNVLWAGQIGSNNTLDHDNLYSFSFDTAGNLILIGELVDTLDVDPGSGTTLLLPTGDYFVSKYSPSGTLLMAYALGGPGATITRSIASLNGEIYVSGYMIGTVDMDPTAAVANYSDIAPDGSTYDIFITKLGPDCSHQWTQILDRTSPADMLWYGVNLAEGPSGNVYLYGLTSPSTDLDPTAGVYLLSVPPPISDFNPFIVKFDAAGSYNWAKYWRNPFPYTAGVLSINIQGVMLDSLENVYLKGQYGGMTTMPDVTVDFDPGPGFDNHTSDEQDGFFIRLNSTGNYIGSSFKTGPGSQYFEIGQDNRRNFYERKTAGTDLDPGPGVFVLPAPGITYAEIAPDDFRILSLIHLGTYGADPSSFSFTFSYTGQLVISGKYQGSYVGGIDLDPGPGSAYVGGSNILFFGTSLNDSCSALLTDDTAYLDGTCSAPAEVAVRGFGGTPPYSYLWSSVPPDGDSVHTSASSGIFSVTVTDDIGCTREVSYYFDNPFPVGFDLEPTLIAGSHIPGMPMTMNLNLYNHGCTGTPAILTLIHDSEMTYTGADIPPTSVSGDTLRWDITTPLTPLAGLFNQVYWITGTTLGITDSVHYNVSVTPVAGDSVPSNNEGNYAFAVKSAYDPNDKQVYPQGYCIDRLVEREDFLTYHVRFQNTGTAAASNIHILDSLDPALNIGTLDVSGSSHALITQVLPGNVLDFNFDDINLPDSLSDPEGSKGWLSFRIRPLNTAPLRSIVTNEVSIYFDYNPPVITNQVENTLEDTLVWFEDAFICSGEDYTFPDGSIITGITAGLSHTSLFPSPDGCDSVVVTKVNINPNLSVNILGSTLTAAAIGATFQWVNCVPGYLPIAGATGSSFTPTANGSYAVIVTQGGCTDTSACFPVIVFGTGNSQPDIVLEVYPNPANSRLAVTVEDGDIEISMVNMLGTEVMDPLSGASDYNIDVHHLPAAIYLLKAKKEGYLISGKTIVIVH